MDGIVMPSMDVQDSQMYKTLGKETAQEQVVNNGNAEVKSFTSTDVALSSV